MTAEVIAIGDELASGQRLDTNSRWLSQQLGELGVSTVRHTTIGDDMARNVEALRSAAAASEIVICTGGLGPTLDDLTRQAMAAAFDRPLELCPDSLATIEAMFASRNREMPERNRSQAMFPAGSLVVPNPHGSAPGVDLTVQSAGHASRIFALPGVPAEMKQMWHETVAVRLQDSLGLEGGPLRYHAIKLFGVGESDVEVKLPTLIERARYPTVGITVSRATITLRIAGRAESDLAFRELIQPTIAEIEAGVGELIFGSGDDELEHAVTRQLRQQSLSLATLEIGAASWINDWMLAADETGDGPYCGGAAFPNATAATRWLGEHWDSRAADGDLDDEYWSALATQAAARFLTEAVLVVGTYPSKLAMENPQGPFEPVCVFRVDGKSQVLRLSMGGHPDVLGPRIAKTGLDWARRCLAAR